MLPAELNQKYEVRGTLGAGAMGTVYDAVDRIIERRAAIKVVSRPTENDPEAVEAHARFRREAQAAGRLSHPNIVGVYDYGENASQAWIVMELVEGGSLKGRLDRHERFPIPEVVRIMGEVCAALQYSHQRGVVHRDIKPGNIMMTTDGQVKIADFGIARLENSSMTQVGTLIGTPSYMAPEQFRGEPVDLRADIWAAGVMLYQLLTGEKPFEGGFSAVMHKALHTEPPPPSSLSVTTPRAFDGVIARALAKRPDDRYRSATEFAEAIRQAATAPSAPAPSGLPGLPGLHEDATVVSSHGTASVRPAGPQPAAPPVQGGGGKGAPIGLIAGGAGVLVAIAAAVWFFVIRPDPGPDPLELARQQELALQEARARAAAEREAVEREAAARAQAAREAAEREASAREAAAREAAAREQAAAEAAARQAAAQQQAARDQAAAEAAAREAAAREAAARDAAARERAARERATAEAAAREAAAREQAAREQAARDQAAREQAQRERAAAEAAAREAAAREQAAREAAIRDQATRDQVARDQAARDQAARDQAARDQAARDQAAREQAARDQAERDRLAREEAARQQQLALARLDMRAAAQSLASGTPCSLIAWSASDRTMTLAGVVRRGDDAVIRQNLASRGVPEDAATLTLSSFDGPYCPALDLLRPVLGPAGAAPSVSVVGPTPLQRGELMRLDVQMPEWPAHLYVAYFMKSGEVANLVPSALQQAGAHVRLGEPTAGFTGWEVDEPFGTDLAVVIASDRPLFGNARPLVESQQDYINALGAALRNARASGTRVVVRPVVVETVLQR